MTLTTLLVSRSLISLPRPALRRPRRQSVAAWSLFLLLAAAPAALPAEPASAARAMFRGQDGAGWVHGGLPDGEGALAFEVGWKRAFGSGYSGISVADGRLITAMADGERDFVVALDAGSGAELWRLDLAPTYAGHDGSHDGPIATPAVADGRVFMLGPQGHLVAIELVTGQRLWAKHLVEDLGREAPYYGFGGSPAVVGELVIVQIGGAEGAVAAFEAATGELRWQALDGAGDLGAQSPIVAEVGGQLQVLILGTAKLAGLDPADGKVLWELALEGESGAMGSYTQSPLPIDGDRIFIKHQDGESNVVQVTRGETGWQAAVVKSSRGLVRSYSPPSRGEEQLFGYSGRMLSALDPGTGELLWRSRYPGDGFLIHVGGQLAVLTKTGSLHLGAASPAEWSETARLDLFEDLAWTPPSWGDGALFVRSLGEIARVNLVRRARARSAAQETELPKLLEPLATALAAGGDASAAVDRFLAGKALPLVEGERVVFLWRGAAEDVAIGGDMIGMRREEPMRRLEGTDLWWWSTELDRHARISYLFFVDEAPTVDPSHDRRTRSTVLGPDMNWNRGAELAMSWFAMPEWPGLAAPEGLEPGAQTAPRGRLETIEIAVQPPTPDGGETPEPVVVKTHVWLPAGYDQSEERFPVVYVHHPDALVEGDWQAALERVVGKTAAPLIAVFPEAPRMRGFGALFVEQVVPEIDARYRTRAERAFRANVGMGWQGLAALMITFGHPDTFGRLAIQSLYMMEDELAGLQEATAEIDAQSHPMDVYLEWGRWDLISRYEAMNFRVSSGLAWELLADKGWRPTGGEVWDSTDFGSWRNRTDVVLEQLFPLGGAAESLARWRTDGSSKVDRP